MKEEKIGVILLFINKYVNEYLNDNIIDYYDLFNLDKNDDIGTIRKKLHKLRVYMHPDSELHLPEFMRSYFSEIIKEFYNCIDCFSSLSNRRNYDEKIKEFKAKKVVLEQEKKSQQEAEKQKEKNKYQDDNSKKNNNKDYEKENNQHKEEKENKDTSSEPFYGKYHKHFSKNYKNTNLETVKDSVMETYKKHDFAFLKNSFNGILNSCDGWENRFSRGGRSALRSMGLEKVQGVIKTFSNSGAANDVVFLNYLGYLYREDEEFRESLEPFINACVVTLEKYDRKQVMDAIRYSVQDRDLHYFTNKDGARTNLKNNVNIDNIKYIPYIVLASERDCENFIHDDMETANAKFVSFCEREYMNNRAYEKTTAQYK